ncbi:MAG: tetratricopeptide repeat protein [Acidobacteriota bacterium]
MSARRLLFYLLLAGALARVLYLTQVAALPFFQHPVGDSASYLHRADEILSGRLVADRPFFYGGIFYPYLLALGFAVLGKNLYPICLAQAGAGCAMAWVLFRLARGGTSPGQQRHGLHAGVLAAGVCLFYGPFAFLEADILMISWTLLLVMTASLLALTAAQESKHPMVRLLLAGTCLGLAASERPNLIALLPAFVAWILLLGGPARRWRGAAALLAGGGVVVLAVAALNPAASGRWVVLTTSGGINFYIGNHPGARGTFDEPWSARDPAFTARNTDLEESNIRMARRLTGRQLDATEASRYWLARGMEFLTTQPAAALRLYVRKLLLLWNAEEVPNHLNYAFMRTVAPSLWLMPLGFGLIAPLGLYGFLAPGSRRLMTPQLLVLLALLVMVPMVTLLPFFVADRYRIVFVPPLVVAAGFGAVALWRSLARRGSRRVAAMHLIGLLVLGAGIARPMTRFDFARDYWMLAQAQQEQGDLSAAADSYRRALKSSPADAVLLNNYGVVLRRLGRAEGAEAAYRKAIAADPALGLPRKNLGLLLMEGGRTDEAFEHLSRAERDEPADPDIARALAVLLFARGDRAAAEEHARRVLADQPGDRTAREVLRRLADPLRR